MSSGTTLQNAYTHAPRLHSNLILASLQLAFWLFFHPSAWRNHIASIDLNLRPDFCLTDLTQEQWGNPALRQFLLMIYFFCLTLTILIAAALGLFGLSSHYALIGVVGLVMLGLVGSVAVGNAMSVASSVAVTVTGIVTCCLMWIITGNVGIDTALETAVDIVAVVAGTEVSSLDLRTIGIALIGIGFGIAIGVAASMLGILGMPDRGGTQSLFRQISGFAMGVVVGLLTYGFTLAMTSIVLNALEISYIIGLGGSIAAGIAHGMAFGIRTGRWKRGLQVGILIILMTGIATGLASIAINNSTADSASGLMLGVAAVVAVTAWISAYLALSCAVARRVAGPWASAAASMLGGAGVVLIAWIILGKYSTWPDLPIGLVSILGGFTFYTLRPFAFYPFQLIWNTALYYADLRRPGKCSSLLRWHSAFWDEYQRLPLFGLDDHLVLVTSHWPVEGGKAIEYLSNSRQRWAAQSAQIELDARQFEYCTNVEAIGKAYHSSAVGDLEGSASSFLRSLSHISQDIEASLNQMSVYHKRLAFKAVEDDLDGKLRELTRSSERYAVRFRPIVSHWRQVVAEHVRELTEAVAQSQLIDNPYIVGLPLTEQQQIFVGRTDVSAHIEQLLLDQRRPPLLLYGQRRMGKTSLLRNLGRLLPNAIVPLFVDGEAISLASDYPDLLYNTARAMARSAEEQRGLILPPLSREGLVANPFTRFNEWLDEIEQVLEVRGQSIALFALDEFEAIDYVMNKGRFDETDVLRTLRHLIQHRARFKILLAGSHTLDEFQHWAGYLVNVRVVKIGYLEEGEARQLVEYPVTGFPLRYESDASRRVLKLTRGHPLLVQLLCSEIVEFKNECPIAERRLVTLADVEAAVPRATASGEFFFVDIQENQADSIGLALLRFVASHGEGAVVSRDVLTGRFRGQLDKALTLLLRRDLIEAAGNGYRFQVELIRRWFSI